MNAQRSLPERGLIAGVLALILAFMLGSAPVIIFYWWIDRELARKPKVGGGLRIGGEL